MILYATLVSVCITDDTICLFEKDLSIHYYCCLLTSPRRAATVYIIYIYKDNFHILIF